MVHFLRTKANETIIECEVYNNDLSAATNLVIYSLLLLDIHNIDSSQEDEFIEDISNLDEIRGWWWENANEDNWESIDKFVETQFLKIAKKYQFNYVTD